MSRPAQQHGEPADEAFGRAVKMVMFSKRVTGRRLAAQLGMHESGLSKKLYGERPWMLSEQIAVADILGVDLRDLLGAMWTTPGAPAGQNEGGQPTRQKVARKTSAPDLAKVIPIRPEHAMAVGQ
jgi:transcriptional regulator with XRE-family HTH domain